MVIMTIGTVRVAAIAALAIGPVRVTSASTGSRTNRRHDNGNGAGRVLDGLHRLRTTRDDHVDAQPDQLGGCRWQLIVANPGHGESLKQGRGGVNASNRGQRRRRSTVS
jgi:hypothetical protein